MSNLYIKLFPDGCQVKYFHYKNSEPVKLSRSDSVLPSSQEHSDYVSLSRTKKRIYDYARSNDFRYFVTLTFDPAKVDSFSCDDTYLHMQNWLKNIKRKFPDLKYLGVPELHKSGRFHFHFLMSDDIKSVLLDSGKRDGDHVIYNVGSYRFGFSTAIEIYDRTRIPSYMVKYITKDLKTRSPYKRRYWNSHNLDLPECYAASADIEEFASILENLHVTYSSKRESDFSYCDFFEVSSESLSLLYPFFSKYKHESTDYSALPEGFFPVKSDTPFD